MKLYSASRSNLFFYINVMLFILGLLTKNILIASFIKNISRWHRQLYHWNFIFYCTKELYPISMKTICTQLLILSLFLSDCRSSFHSYAYSFSLSIKQAWTDLVKHVKWVTTISRRETKFNTLQTLMKHYQKCWNK